MNITKLFTIIGSTNELLVMEFERAAREGRELEHQNYVLKQTQSGYEANIERLIQENSGLKDKIEKLHTVISKNNSMLNDVIRIAIDNYPQRYKIQAIKAVREITNLGLLEAKNMVEDYIATYFPNVDMEA